MKKKSMVLSPCSCAQEWDARYLMLLSHLNFEYELTLICLPGAAQSCTWDDKQWQALSLYGLENCYHITGKPPIASTCIDGNKARQVISKESTLLHICHWQGWQHLEDWLPLVSEGDVLVIYGTMDENTFHEVASRWPSKHCHIVNPINNPHINEQYQSKIDHKQWTQLLQTHQATLTWK